MSKLGEAKVVECPDCGRRIALVYTELYPALRGIAYRGTALRGTAWWGICRGCGRLHIEAEGERRAILNAD